MRTNYAYFTWNLVNLSKFYLKRMWGLGIKEIVEMPGIEPGTFHMQSERSTAELQPHTIGLH